jgi:hypothetical protein
VVFEWQPEKLWTRPLLISRQARPRGHSACSIDLVYRFRLGLLVVDRFRFSFTRGRAALNLMHHRQAVLSDAPPTDSKHKQADREEPETPSTSGTPFGSARNVMQEAGGPTS